ncbi:MAG: molecular chaperone HtpG [Planctomycetota bacterium]|jgi:molecular chaperone HtpG
MSATAEPMTETEGKEELQFQAEVARVLDIVVNSLYSNKDIFLRERLVPGKENKTLTISDNGIGMTRDELIKNLGTIAHSGSQTFLEALKQKNESGLDLIGQFGVGFYSAFLVADEVEVTSRAADSDQAWRWTSSAHGTFTVEPVEKETRGTDIKLHLKADQADRQLTEYHLKDLVSRYSDYVSHPIELLVEREETIESPEAEEGDEKAEKKTEKISRFETINRGKAIWEQHRDEIKDEQYKEFYKHLTHDYDEPLAWNHFKIEGTQMFKGLLYTPKRPPFDMFDQNKRRGVKLYVKRVFIMDDCEELLPPWLRFLRGVIDSDDLPLNVSRELLQEENIVRTIKKQVIKKTFDMLEELATDEDAEKYKSFWTAFGIVLKEGLHASFEYRDRLAKLTRYRSSASEFTSLAEYVERMPEGQKAIYFVIGDNVKAIEGSPHTEALRKRGFEVLYFTDAVDEWAIQGLTEFEGKRLVSAMKGELDLDTTDEDKESADEKGKALEGLFGKIKSVLEEQVNEVKLSTRLTDSPCCLIVPEHGMHAHMERLLRAHDREIPTIKRIFEVNPDHAIIQHLQKAHTADADSGQVKEWIELLHDQALITEGSSIKDPQGFAKRITALMTATLG